jgi:hypothetical protein
MEGYVYVLTNKAYRGLVKIGRTTNSVEERAQKLSSTGVPFPFEIAFKMKVTDCVACEKWLHNKFSHKRVNDGKEFFRVPAREVIISLKEKVSPGTIKREKEEKKREVLEEARSRKLQLQEEERSRELQFQNEETLKREAKKRAAEKQKKIDVVKGVFGLIIGIGLIIGVGNFVIQFIRLIIKLM